MKVRAHWAAAEVAGGSQSKQILDANLPNATADFAGWSGHKHEPLEALAACVTGECESSLGVPDWEGALADTRSAAMSAINDIVAVANRYLHHRRPPAP